MFRVVRLRKDGDSVVLSVPRPLLRALGWTRGDCVGVAVESGRFVAARIDPAAAIAPAAPAPLAARRGRST